jgi:D-amino-acid oxidase
MAHTSWKTYRSYLGLPGNPVQWADRYNLSDLTMDQARAEAEALNTLGFADYSARIADLVPRAIEMPAGSTPFPVKHVRRTTALQFNIASYAHTLLNDFRLAGGAIQMREFHSPSELTQLAQKVVINCPGYGARALWKDESVVPVRGQIGWLLPQPEVTHGIGYHGVSVVSRSDGIVVQAVDGVTYAATRTPMNRPSARNRKKRWACWKNSMPAWADQCSAPSRYRIRIMIRMVPTAPPPPTAP